MCAVNGAHIAIDLTVKRFAVHEYNMLVSGGDGILVRPAEIDMITRVYAHILDEDRKVNAQKFESAFYANPDLREVRAPQEQQPKLNLENLLLQLQQSPELADTLANLLAQRAKTA